MDAQLSCNLSMDTIKKSSLRFGNFSRFFMFCKNLDCFLSQGSFIGRVNLNHTASDDRFKKHSALVITKPSLNDSGIYTCNVQTFEGIEGVGLTLQVSF